MMKNPSLKTLCTAVSTLMAMATLGAQSAKASDTEIYQEAKQGTATLMLQIDISGSMNLTSVYDDYRAVRVEPNHPSALNSGLVTSHYPSGSTYAFNLAKFDHDVSPNGVTRRYFAVPKTPENTTQINYNLNNGKTTGKDLRGCPIVTRSDGIEEYRCYTRVSRMQEAFVQVLSEKNAKGEYVIDDDKAIGLSAFSLKDDGQTGYILAPAHRLGDPSGSGTHRDELIAQLKGLDATGGTPTANAYAETMAYMFGTSVNDGVEREYFSNFGTNYYFICRGFTASSGNTACDTWYNIRHPVNAKNFPFVDTGKKHTFGSLQVPIYKNQYQGGFNSSIASSKNVSTGTYIAPKSLTDQKTNPKLQQCSGQGIYVLTDGEPNTNYFARTLTRAALKNPSFNCTQNSVGWDCMHKAAQELLDPSKNPSGLKIKTAVVGFGTSFNSVQSYNPSLSKAENLKKVDESTSDNADVKNAARWGILGEGGWYSGNSPDDIIKSINAFLAELKAEIPATVTGQPFIPIDPLNQLAYMNEGFYGAFTPLPGKKRTFWSGDINKYSVLNQSLYGKDGTSRLFDSAGLMDTSVQGWWSSSNGNGMAAQLPLKDKNRAVFTNLDSSANTSLTKITKDKAYDNSLTGPVDPTNLTDPTNLNNLATRNAWLNLLGYNIAFGVPVAETALSAEPELRQLGALMHSTPIILTQKGEISTSSGSLDTSKNRTDYILFGSTQGILHVVDSEGKEKIAFVPKEMMSNQKNNFQHVDSATSSSSAADTMLYGIDGQWTAYTQYMPATGGGFTVNGATGATSTNLGGKGLQWVYGGLRMGGRSYYALDLSDIDNPTMKFHIDPSAAAAGTPLSYMGQSWSKPTLGFVRWNGERRLVMFVGGGYDEGYENRTYDQTNGKGAGVYMFDAHNGELLWWGSSHATGATTGSTQSTNNSSLKYSVASNIATYDRNNDGLVDHLLFGDLGGQVFRVDLDNNYNYAAGKKLATRIVRMYNGHKTGGLSPRFYETPSLSAHSGIGAEGQFGIISIASGNRSSPLAEGADSAQDALFVLYDHDILRSGIVQESATPYVTDNATDNLVVNTANNAANGTDILAVESGTRKPGWKYYLSSTAGSLKGYSTPRVVDNLLFLNTYTPDGGIPQDSCNAGIIGESYQEVFCLPGGTCKNNKLFDNTISVNLTGLGSPYRLMIGMGIVQTAVGNAGSDTSAQGVYGGTTLTVDCTAAANKNSLACMKETSSITNKPVRWYEDTPRS